MFTNDKRWLLRFRNNDKNAFYSGGEFFFASKEEMLEFVNQNDITVEKMFHLVEVEIEKEESAQFESSLKVCPECQKIASYNSYFGGYVCPNCGWYKPTDENAETLEEKEVNVNIISLDADGKEKTTTVKVCKSVKEAEVYVKKHEQDFADDPDVYMVEIETVSTETVSL